MEILAANVEGGWSDLELQESEGQGSPNEKVILGKSKS